MITRQGSVREGISPTFTDLFCFVLVRVTNEIDYYSRPDSFLCLRSQKLSQFWYNDNTAHTLAQEALDGGNGRYCVVTELVQVTIIVEFVKSYS